MYVKDRPLVIDVARQGEAVVCKLVGAATMDMCATLNERLAELGAEEGQTLLIDLSKLEFICSLGLGSIVAAYTRAVRRGGTVRLIAPCEPVREMLAITRLDALIPIVNSVEEAVRGQAPALR